MSERTRDLVMGTAGHIDHGKTALVRALTGVDTDRLPAEKLRGITIDLGFASLSLPGRQVAVIDVPGHERFIRNMLAGATGLDLAMLVIAADDSVMPQTREHLEILRLLGLSHGLVALTKCDLVDSGWIDLVEEDVKTLTRGTFLESAPIVRTSVASGLGIDELRKTIESVCAEVGPARDSGVFRMAIDRSFTLSGHGTVVTGTVASGEVAVGDELEWHPAGKLVRVRGLHQHDRAVASVARGGRAAINLAGIHHDAIRRGNELAAPGYLEPSQIVTVELAESPGALRSPRHRGRYKLHVGTAEVSAVLSILANDASPTEPRTSLAQLFVAEPIVAIHGQPFVLREESPPRTVGGGRVLQPAPRRYRRRDRVAIERLTRFRSAEPLDRVTAALLSLGLAPWTKVRLCALSGLDPSRVESALSALAGDGALVNLPVSARRTVGVLADHVGDLENRITTALDRLHAARPRLAAIPRAHLAAALPDLLGNDALVAAILERLISQKKVVADERTVAIPGHEPRLSQGERKLKEELAAAIKAGGNTPPDLAELTALAGPRGPAVHDLLTLLCDENRVVEINATLFLDAEVENQLRERVRTRLADGSSITMAELRDLLGTTRKFAVPLGEFFDRIQLTEREGDTRRLAASRPPSH